MANVILRPEPYNPDAIDADGDGIVQERTAWERPVGTRVLDHLGQAIHTGRSLTERPAGLQIVDGSGKPVKYNPSYAGELTSGATAKLGRGPSSPLSDHGHLSLTERGLPTIRSIATPAPPSAPSQPATPVHAPGSPEAIRAKNKNILDRIKELGGEFGNVNNSYVTDMRNKGYAFKGIHQVQTREGITASRNRIVEQNIRGMRSLLLGEEGELFDGANKILNAHPDIQKLILESSDDEIMAKLSEAAMEFHQGVVPNVFVQMKPENFGGFLGDGVYKTTHSPDIVGTSPPDLRTSYEVALGYPPDAPADLRPASGYIIHKDWIKTDDGPFGHDKTNAGRVVGPYGTFQLRLKQDVSQRSGYGYGDSLTVNLAPTAFDESDPEAVMNALVMSRPGGLRSAEGDDNVASQMLGLLEGQRRGSYEKVHAPNAGSPDAVQSDSGSWDYVEALIPGSFSLDEVEAIQVKHRDFAHFAMNNEKNTVQEKIKQVLDTEKLRDMGFSEQEIKYLYSVIDDNPGGMPMAAAVKRLVEYKAMKREKDRIDKLGPKLKVTTDTGLDLFSPEFYGGNTGDDVEKLLMDKLNNGLLSATRKAKREQDQIAENLRTGQVAMTQGMAL